MTNRVSRCDSSDMRFQGVFRDVGQSLNVGKEFRLLRRFRDEPTERRKEIEAAYFDAQPAGKEKVFEEIMRPVVEIVAAV